MKVQSTGPPASAAERMGPERDTTSGRASAGMAFQHSSQSPHTCDIFTLLEQVRMCTNIRVFTFFILQTDTHSATASKFRHKDRGGVFHREGRDKGSNRWQSVEGGAGGKAEPRGTPAEDPTYKYSR